MDIDQRDEPRRRGARDAEDEGVRSRNVLHNVQPGTRGAKLCAALYDDTMHARWLRIGFHPGDDPEALGHYARPHDARWKVYARRG